MIKWLIVSAAVVAASLLGYAVYDRSDLVAPYVVSQRSCGPIQPHVERINLSGGGQRLARSFPVHDGGDPLEERYMNAVASNLVAKVQQTQPAVAHAEPFKLDILFVQSDQGLDPGAKYDFFGSKPRLTSPWVRITKSDWSPCEMQAIFFRQGRQIARDQMEMLAAKPLRWPSAAHLSDAEISKFKQEYVHNIIGPDAAFDRREALKDLSRRLPPDLFFAFRNSPQTTIHPPALGFGIFLKTDPNGYINHVNSIVDNYISRGSNMNIGSVSEVDYGKSGYLLANVIK